MLIASGSVSSPSCDRLNDLVTATLPLVTVGIGLCRNCCFFSELVLFSTVLLQER